MATFTNAGMAAVAGLVNGNGAITEFTYLAIGSGDTAEAATQTALVTEITTNGGARASASVSRVTTTVTNDTAQWVKTWTFTGSLSINECGVLNAASSGTMLMRHKFTATKNVENGDSLELTVKMQISA